MTSKTKIKFAATKQARSKNTLLNIFEAAEQLVITGNPIKFTVRELSRVSGYAIGTLSTRLESIDNVFISIIERRRDNELEKLCKLILDFPKNKTITVMASLIAEKSFESIARANPRVIRYIESQLIKKSMFQSTYYHYVDPVSDALFKVHKKNTSNTFGIFTKTEIKLFSRGLMRVLERPFVEMDPIAGSKKHRKIFIKCFVRLFGK
jgi:hypothetical protein